MTTGQVRIFIQPRCQGGVAYEVARVRGTSRAVEAVVRPLLGSFEVAYHGVREPAPAARRAGSAVGGGR